MRSLFTATAALVAVMAMASPAAADPSTSFDRAEVSVAVGDRFTLVSTTAGLDSGTARIAHLNVVSLTPDVYVDPEDWSGERTQNLGTHPLTWDIQAVNAGEFDVYVVIVPTGGTGPLSVSAPVHVHVAERRAINAGGALPVAIVVPVLLSVGMVVVRRVNRAREVR